ncbi:sugar ABC transporter ATP-binding protein [Capillimicrobium parvum]|uniref:Ribose import ATP-binding protein RbsA n=1 Tax=Capillimicrobium parvum TaxID=2884022 RepID=A0A9E6XZN7_9ACTN|nr:sugar ABC transporter ATP-binding protein [Capillimicrobium parvum]UGS36998.1 Ribose import ATP-binding protein RbsA [Capillimicrobium parvum]
MTTGLEVESLSKTFPGQKAVDDVELRIAAGEIFGLVGQNGSGKSTIIKVLAGYHRADPGARATLYGRPLDLEGGAGDDRLRFIHQDLGLVGSLDAVDNVGLGSGFDAGRLGRIRWRAQRRRVVEALAQFGIELDVTRPVSQLSAAERAAIAIVRATIGWGSSQGVLVLDEPTAALPEREVERLFATVRRIAGAGAGVLFVSHRLEEILALCDRVGVLRDGRMVAVRPAAELTHDDLVTLIAGRPVEQMYPAPVRPREAVVMRARALSGGRLRDLDLDLHEREVLGVTGLLGSGREDVADVLFGSHPGAAGDVDVDGVPIGLRSPAVCVRRGLVMVPADRSARALVPGHSARANITLPRLRPLWTGTHLSRRRERRNVRGWAEAVELVPPDPERPIDLFSGGNQQKAVLARWLRTDPRVLVLDEPTQGVDVAAKSAIYRLLAERAQGGTGIVICSAELEDLAEVCDRVLVLRDGRVSQALTGESLTEHALLVATLGGAPQSSPTTARG